MDDQIIVDRISAAGLAPERLWPAVRELCCRTGNAGAPISTERWELFGKIWIEPYRLLAPDWTYVALADGKIIGYLTGCPDTKRFARQYFMRCALPLVGQVVCGGLRHDRYGQRFVRQTLWLERSALGSFPWALRRAMPRLYPAHLHMNVAAAHRGSGVGTRLLRRYCDDLRAARVPGLHLFCGAAPEPFYRRHGFRSLAVASVRGNLVHAMALDL